MGEAVKQVVFACVKRAGWVIVARWGGSSKFYSWQVQHSVSSSC